MIKVKKKKKIKKKKVNKMNKKPLYFLLYVFYINYIGVQMKKSKTESKVVKRDNKKLSAKGLPTLDLNIKSFKSLGRYNKTFAERFIKLSAQGKDINTICCELGITKKTFYDYINPDSSTYKAEFHAAVEIGRQFCEAWWSEVGRINLNNSTFNATLYMMNMQNRFGWTRRLEGRIIKEEHETKTIKHEVQIVSDENIAEIARILAECGAFKSGVEETPEAKTH